MNNEFEAVSLWQSLLIELKRNPQEIHTTKKCGDVGIWISVEAGNDTVIVNRAKQNSPSSSISEPRSITKSEFVKLYPNYFKWRKGEMTRNQAKGGSMNSSYIFALISKFGS